MLCKWQAFDRSARRCHTSLQSQMLGIQLLVWYNNKGRTSCRSLSVSLVRAMVFITTCCPSCSDKKGGRVTPACAQGYGRTRAAHTQTSSREACGVRLPA